MKIFSRIVLIYLVPGVVIQSVTIGGGYGTGREIVEYFTQYGVTGGILGMCLAIVCFAVVIATTFEIARCFRAYDYRSYLFQLIGRACYLYDVIGICMFLIVLAIIGAATGSVLSDTFGLPVWVGSMVMLVIVMLLNFYGRELVTKVLLIWSVFLYAVFIIYFIIIFARYSSGIIEQLQLAEVRSGWAVSALQYSLYNLAAVPIVLYAARHIETRIQSIVSGIIASVFTILPGLLLHLSFASSYPDIVEQSLPTYWMIQLLSIPLLMSVFVIVLFGTFIETACGLLQGLNERLDQWQLERKGKTFSRKQHAMTAGLLIISSIGLSTFGIIALISHAYGFMAWCFLLVYILPTLTIGIYTLAKLDSTEKNGSTATVI